MTDRPILFSAPMVRAILAGTKTQTRRVVKLPHQNPLGVWEPQTIGGPNGGRLSNGNTIPEQGAIWHTRTGDSIGCPYGQPGDRLWVRETFALLNDSKDPENYRATRTMPPPVLPWRPSIHMPRWASRITLDITGVRVERLQDISEADALAEGIVQLKDGGYGLPAGEHYHSADPRQSYLSLWEAINGPGSVEANPWVWVVEFPRLAA